MAEIVSDLQALVQQWGEKFSQRYGTTCKWVDLHAKKSDMSKFQHFKVSVRVNDSSYEVGKTTEKDLPGVSFEQTFINESDTESEESFKRSTSTPTNLTWTITTGLNIGVPLSGPASVPSVLFETSPHSHAISIDSTESQTKSDSRNWEVDKVQRVPPHSRLDIMWAVNRKQYASVFTMEVIIGGYVAIKNHDKIVDVGNSLRSGKQKLWFVPIDRVFREMKEWGIEFPSQYSIGDGLVRYMAAGRFEGEAGAHISSYVKATSLSSHHE